MTKSFNSKYLAILLSLIFVILHYYIRTYNYQNWNNILGWDVLSYYIYLPFTFIYHDPGIVNQLVLDKIFQQYHPSGTLYQIYQLPNGNWVSMYSMGFAILFAPFFFIAHLWASLTGTYPADGFSFPYQYCIGNGVMLYIIAGIFVIRKVLLHFFTDKVTMAVMIFLLLGTNYFHEASSDECMPHAILFTFYALILWFTIRWHQNPTRKSAALLGLILGFTILARGSAIVCLIIPVLWNIYDKESWLSKWKMIVANFSHILIAVIMMSLIPVCQMLFWKQITGHFLFDSYQNTEGFDWDGQHIMKVLFSYKKSWFIYTPIIILPIIGILMMRKMAKEIYAAIGLFFLFNFYLISGWAAWWQGGSFGLRYFVESYAVMAIPFGYFIKRISELKIIPKVSLFSIAVLLTCLNLFQTWQFNAWIIDGYSMTKKFYWRAFLKTSVTDEDRKLKEIDRGGFGVDEALTNPGDYTSKTIGYYNFSNINASDVDTLFIDTTYFASAPSSCHLTKDRIYSPTFKMPFSAITDKEHAWIRVSFDYFSKEDMKNVPASLVIHFDHSGRHTYKYKGWDLDKLPSVTGNWNHFSVDYLTPYPLSVNDKLQVYVYLRGDKDLYIDNLQIKAFERKW